MDHINLTHENWESEVSKSEIPVLVDFWSPDCQPCRQMATQLDALAKLVIDTNRKLKIAKLNIYECPEIGMDNDVMGMPTLVLFNRGREVARQDGVGKFDRLIQLVNPHWIQ